MRHVEQLARGAESLPASYVTNNALRSLGQEVAGRAGDWGEVDVGAMREALDFVGADLRKADTREPKGVLDEREIAKLDPKSARFLANASGVPARNLEILSI